MKIAIIGSGIAGNTAAWMLDHSHEVTVFEANSFAGGHTHTHSLEIEARQINVDSGFIVFNERTYPNFLQMLDRLDVEKQPTEMSFSMHCERTGLEYAGTSLNSVFAQRRNLANPKFIRLLADILRFNKQAPTLLDYPNESITLGDYLRDEKYSPWFLDYYILPMGAAIWSQDTQSMLHFPAQFFIRFFNNHGLLSLNNRPQWYTVKGGSKTYVEKIYAGFRGQLLLESPVEKVHRFADHVEVVSRHGHQRFDAVFLACHSEQALNMLSQPTETETSILGALPYRANTAVLHLGDELLPERQIARSSWNYRIPGNSNRQASVTYDMKRLQSLPLKEDICVTLNANDTIPEEKILAAMTYAHPEFGREGIAAQKRHSEVNGENRTFYCGAYWRYGFHEDGVVSAMQAVEDFNHWAQRRDSQPVYRVA